LKHYSENGQVIESNGSKWWNEKIVHELYSELYLEVFKYKIINAKDYVLKHDDKVEFKK